MSNAIALNAEASERGAALVVPVTAPPASSLLSLPF